MKEEYKFKTSINCGGCVARVTPILNKLEGIESWKVDIDNPDKILTIKSNGATEQHIIAAVQSIGFDIKSM